MNSNKRRKHDTVEFQDFPKAALSVLVDYLEIRDICRLCTLSVRLHRMQVFLLARKRSHRYLVLDRLSATLPADKRKRVATLTQLFGLTRRARSNLSAFTRCYGGIPDDLLRLMEFAEFIRQINDDEMIGETPFFSSFDLTTMDYKNNPLADWAQMCSSYFDCGGKAFLEMVPFASTGAGGILGVWNPSGLARCAEISEIFVDSRSRVSHVSDDPDVDRMPIASLDSEGGGEVCCLTLRECFSVLANQFGQEIGDFFVQPEERELVLEEAEEMLDSSDGAADARDMFCRWLKLSFGLDPAPNPSALQAKAQESLPSVEEWIRECCKDETQVPEIPH